MAISNFGGKKAPPFTKGKPAPKPAMKPKK